MSIFDELTEEIMTWLDDDQDPECIKKDIMRTVEEAINARDNRKYKTDLAQILQLYMEDKHGEENVRKVMNEKAYLDLADSVLQDLDKAYDVLQSLMNIAAMFDDVAPKADTQKETLTEVAAKAEAKPAQTQEEKDAAIIKEFVDSVEALHKAALGGVKTGRSGVGRRSNNPFDF